MLDELDELFEELLLLELVEELLEEFDDEFDEELELELLDWANWTAVSAARACAFSRPGTAACAPIVASPNASVAAVRIISFFMANSLPVSKWRAIIGPRSDNEGGCPPIPDPATKNAGVFIAGSAQGFLSRRLRH